MVIRMCSLMDALARYYQHRPLSWTPSLTLLRPCDENMGSGGRIRSKHLFFVVVGMCLVFSILAIYYLPDLNSATTAYFKYSSALRSNLNVLSAESKIAKRVAGRHILNFTLDGRHSISLPNGQDPDATIQHRRDTIKRMMIEAWDGYRQYAWGHNELRPLSRIAHWASIFGPAKLGATIVDGMDTLWIMGLRDRFDEGRRWIQDNLDFSEVHSEVSVFETIIRFVGGLLSCYAFTKDEMFLEKAIHLTELMLPAFATPTGLPRSLIKPATGAARNSYRWTKHFPWLSIDSSILAEVGSLHLEFYYLSKVSGNEDYVQRAAKMRDVLDSVDKKPDGLYYNLIDVRTGKFVDEQASIGAFGDSFYEYLLKTWLLSGKQDVTALRMYNQAANALVRNLLRNSSHGLAYFADKQNTKLNYNMAHLACFSAGMFALGAEAKAHPDDNKNEYYHNLAAQIANTCHESYHRTKTGLGPETFWFDEQRQAQVGARDGRYYILRPEVIEGWFYMWRSTKDRKYREWAWAATESIQKYCRSPAGTGYSGIDNVDSEKPKQDDVQQSFFLAETLKYLYLIFSTDDLIPLDRWVFNTEAHPFPITPSQ